MYKPHIEKLVVHVLKELDLYSLAATNLILGTIAQESGMGFYLQQISGPALGIVQMEPATEHDIWVNYLKYKPELRERLTNLTGAVGPSPFKLWSDLAYQVAMCRIHYLRVKEALPEPASVQEIGRYWKRWYNTEQGKGTVAEFMNNYSKYVT